LDNRVYSRVIYKGEFDSSYAFWAGDNFIAMKIEGEIGPLYLRELDSS